MKTIKNNTEVKRVNDREATKMVRDGIWKYCPKSEWKKIHAKKVEKSEPAPKVEKGEKKTQKKKPAHERA